MSRKRRDLDIDEDLAFQEKEWFVQRIGMAVLFLFVLCAALGLTGMGGPLSTAHAGRAEEPVFVEYERFVRHGATSTARLHLRSDPGVVKFWVSAPYAASVRFSSVEPPAQNVVAEEHRHVYAIQTASQEVTVTLVMEPLRFGSINGEIGLVNGPSVRLSQFVLF